MKFSNELNFINESKIEISKYFKIFAKGNEPYL